jgi:hypothetical protein
MLLEGCAEFSFQYGYMKIVIVSYKQLQEMHLLLEVSFHQVCDTAWAAAYASVL